MVKKKARHVPWPRNGASRVSLSMVGFFDILGFSNQVESVQSEADLLKIAGTVESIRKHFEFRSKDKHVRQLHDIMGKRVLAFSDLVVTAVSVHTDFVRNQGLFDTFDSEIVNMAYSQVQRIWDGYFLRGGVEAWIWATGNATRAYLSAPPS
jgi:hypothetical protein